MSKLISKIVVPDSNEATGYSLYNVKDSGAIHSSDVGVAGGVASLDNAGKVPSSQLPSYVDDVVEGYYHENKFYTTYTPGQEEEDPGTYSGEITAETGKIYVDIPTNQSYRWSGSAYIVISSPYVLPTASANTLGGVKVGDNLSIDQNGVLSAQASSPDEVQIGGNTPSSDSDIKIFIDTTEDSTAEVYTKQQQDGKFIVIKDSATEPDESTLTYTENGTIKNFKRGDEIRVPDAEADNGYTFYKLYALTTESSVTTAIWDKLGAGGSANPNETVNISLTQIGGNSADLIGASITITDDYTGDTLLTAIWNGSTITTDIPMGAYYTVSVETIVGYLACADQSYLAGYQTTRNISFEYKALGAYIEATDGTLYTASSWSGSGKTANAIVLITGTDSNKNLRIGLEIAKKKMHSGATASLRNYLTIYDTAVSAANDFDGVGNTDKIISFNAANGTNTTTYAAPWAKAYTFADGTHIGFIPSMGQLVLIYNNITAITNAFSALNITLPSDTYYYSSTLGPHPQGNDNPWEKNIITGQDWNWGTEWDYYVLPICEYNIVQL